MPDQSPHEDGVETTHDDGRPTPGGTVPAAAPPPDDGERDEAERDEGGERGEREASEADGPGTPDDRETPEEPDAEVVAASGALKPEEIDQPVGERDPATGAPVNLPAPTATAAGVQVTPEPDAPDPAHDVEQRRREAGVDHRFPFGRPGQPLGRAHPFVFGFTAALGVITAWLLVQAASNAKSVIVMIVVAMFLAVGLNPAVERLRRFGLPRGAAVAAVFMVVILFFAGFVASLVQPVSEQVTELRKNIPEYVEDLQENKTLANWDKRYGLLDRAEETVKGEDFQKSLTDIATGIGKVAVSGVFQTITILILTLYFMSSLPQIKTFFYKLAPRSRRARVALLGDEILDRIGGYVAGQFTIAFIAGTISYVFLSILGVKYALALALIVAVTDLIPLIGATIGAVVVSLVAFLTGNVTDLIVCAVFYLIYQQVENYLVYPRVMKRTVDVQPAVTIVAALVGGALLGVVGALLAIPTAAAISLLIREIVVPRQETM
ncbi:AI-2E family transporter [Actinomadura sp. KC216]|uniref:AI-2E family transporter n=1 Tax=Actinomadura sp. KC216 TaxID=2530370 RepID=UPI001FB6F7BF|nr:AI-2E family transporter [Actinomadura sp. KC216]